MLLCVAAKGGCRALLRRRVLFTLESCFSSVCVFANAGLVDVARVRCFVCLQAVVWCWVGED